ncbi:MAG: hypothetical protein IPN15_15945 [Saprospiraceae bacterium]|nr:hypothetical protein [Candidatus Vicinibacter affinis]
MKVSILTPESSLYEGQAKAIIMPGLGGQFEYLTDMRLDFCIIQRHHPAGPMKRRKHKFSIKMVLWRCSKTK